VDSDTALDVRAALAQLPVEQRAALVLVDVQGYSVAEAAAVLGVAEGTVKSRCARGRARLAVHLGYLRNPVPGRDVPSQTESPTTATTGEEGR
jgi:RNA polymerase sigma-70 factor (ECF subfamily)